MKPVIYHNPHCSKSRATLEQLQDRTTDVTVIEYLKTPPSAAELKDILRRLYPSARDLLRTQEPEYKTAGIENTELSEVQIIGAIVKNPILLERPIVVNQNQAAIGRPPENIMNIF